MLIRCQPERALVDLGNFLEPSLEFPAGFVQNTPVLDEHRKVVSAVFASVPAKVVDIAVESVLTSRLVRVSEEFFHLSLVHVQSHAVDSVLEASILATSQGGEIFSTEVVRDR